MPLRNREAEVLAIDGLLERARGGESGALVFRGEPGIGLSALLAYGSDSASGMRVLRVAGNEIEFPLPFAALHQLCAPVLGDLGRLPGEQRGALETAFGFGRSGPPDLLLVGLAALSLLARAAEAKPVLCVIDDAERLDAASGVALAFAARRLGSEGIAMVLAGRLPTARRFPFVGLDEMHVGGLPTADAESLLVATAGGPVPEAVRDRILDETGRNPLALIELARSVGTGELTTRTSLPPPLPIGRLLEERFLEQSEALEPDAQLLLLLAAAMNDGDPTVFWSAAAVLGLGPADSAVAEKAGLLRTAAHIVISHPLLRSAVYEAASTADRQRVHQALADSIDPEIHPDGSAWHRAAAALSTDEDAAAGLERAAERSVARGDYASAAALLERAAQLTPDAGDRPGRFLASASASLGANSPGRAAAVVGAAQTQHMDDRQRAEALRLRGAIGLALGQGADSSALLLQAARALDPLDPGAARLSYLEALEASVFYGRLGGGAAAVQVAEAAAAAPSAEQAGESGPDLLLGGLCALLVQGHAGGVPKLRRALATMRESDEPRWFALAGAAALELWDDDTLHALSARRERIARDARSMTGLPFSLILVTASDELVAGRFDAAAELYGEAREFGAADGNTEFEARATLGQLLVASWRGGPDSRAQTEAARRDAMSRGLGRLVALAHYAAAIVELSAGRYPAAVAAARSAAAEDALWVSTHALPELVEAAVRSGDRETAASALALLSERAPASHTSWGLGMVARSRALLSETASAEGLYQEALEHLRLTRAAPHLARAHLIYGEWLRRRRRRRDAREHLRTAYEMFTFMGAERFGERAKVELSATGEHVSPRRRSEPAAADELTPQEARIAQLVSRGRSNAEIAEALFISPRTVEYHLHKIFRKLDVSSRTQLASELLGETGTEDLT
jgi:DNA-binding CsgD family transcriptional regulator